MYLTVKNIGRGRSFETQANVRNLSGDGLLLHEGRFDISNMAPGDVKKVAVHLRRRSTHGPGGEGRAVDLRPRSSRERRREGTHAVRRPAVAWSPRRPGPCRPRHGGALFDVAGSPAARVFGKLPERRRSARSSATSGRLRRRSRWAMAASASSARAISESGGTPAPVRRVRGTRWPTRRRSSRSTRPALATRDTAHRWSTAPRATPSACSTPTSSSTRARSSTARTATAPIRRACRSRPTSRSGPGVNIVSVIARENPDTDGHKTFIIRRDGEADGELLTTPKTDDDLSENGSGQPLGDGRICTGRRRRDRLWP
jgi:carboxyl-terminal processing protease